MNRSEQKQNPEFNPTSLSQVIPVILAAGAGSRLQQIKPLAKYNNTTFIEHCLAQVSEISSQVTIVLGAFADQIAAHLNNLQLSTSLQIIVNKKWQEGLSSSLQAAVMANKDARALLFVTVDQVLIDAQDYMNMVTSWTHNKANMLCASYANTVGIPAIFPAEYFEPLQQLRGDKGAKQLLNDRSRTCYVAIENAALDIDTPEQLASLNSNTPKFMSPTKDITS